MAVKHTIRSNRRNKTRVVKLTPMRGIKCYCEECVGYQKNEVIACTDRLCPLYPFRMGKTGT
jgi:hypothetical protein